MRRTSWRKRTLFVSMHPPPGETVPGFFIYYNRHAAEGVLTYFGLFRCHHPDMLGDDWAVYDVPAQAWERIKPAYDKALKWKIAKRETKGNEHASDNNV